MPRGIYERTDETRNKLSLARMGKVSWNKGKKLSLEHIKNLSLSHKHQQTWLGKKHSKESKEKMRIARLGKPGYWKGKERIDLKGKPRSIETRLKLKEIQKEKVRKGTHHLWKGGISSQRQIIYHSMEYRLWRKSVFERDNYTCVWCEITGGRLEADHIKPFAHYPELRFAIDNGRTLCKPCHRKTDTYGGRTR